MFVLKSRLDTKIVAVRLGLFAAVLGLAACGNYSTEDLRFLAALPAAPVVSKLDDIARFFAR